MQIYDCITYFDEDLLLNFRLNYLNKYVDKFVIVECLYTHRGVKKGFNLDLSKFVEGYGKDQYKYELYGVCNHSGGTRGGHYTSTIRVNATDWYLFNDTNVSKVSFDGKNNTSGYCLFYRKKLNK